MIILSSMSSISLLATATSALGLTQGQLVRLAETMVESVPPGDDVGPQFTGFQIGPAPHIFAKKPQTNDPLPFLWRAPRNSSLDFASTAHSTGGSSSLARSLSPKTILMIGDESIDIPRTLSGVDRRKIDNEIRTTMDLRAFSVDEILRTFGGADKINIVRSKVSKNPFAGKQLDRDQVKELYERWVRNFRGVNLTDIDLTGLVLRNADFTRARLTWAILTETDLTETVLRNADLTGADLRWVILTWADLTQADLTGANLTGAVLKKAALRKSILRGAVLIGANFAGADLTKADLTKVNAIGAVFNEAVLKEANLTRADLTWAILIGANLTKADLTRAILIGTDLTDALLWKAVLKEANPIGAIVSGANFTGVVLSPILKAELLRRGAVIQV